MKARPAKKWLNPKALVEQMLRPENQITKVNYSTARVSARAHDRDAPARQAVYLKALSTVPEITIHEGNFLSSEPWTPLAQPPQAKPDGYQWTAQPPTVVKVLKSEEKGSDVNLGAHLVRDAFTNVFDVAVIITNDSDPVEPVRIAVQEAGKRVGLLVPVKYPTQSLVQVASLHLHIRPGHLGNAQFPNPLPHPDATVLTPSQDWV